MGGGRGGAGTEDRYGAAVRAYLFQGRININCRRVARADGMWVDKCGSGALAKAYSSSEGGESGINIVTNPTVATAATTTTPLTTAVTIPAPATATEIPEAIATAIAHE